VNEAAATYAIVGGAGAGTRDAAIAVIDVVAPGADALDSVLAALGAARPIERGATRLVRIGDVDDALVARVSATHALLFPHAGPAVLTGVIDALRHAGAQPGSAGGPADAGSVRERFPEARDLVEACTLDALARAPSARAVDAVLMHAARWSAGAGTPTEVPADVARQLDRLLAPPTVAAVGRTNVGKSTLVNALAQRTVALTADAPGVTRDHVGVALELDGLAVRWIDTPGIRPAGARRSSVSASRSADAIERAAVEAAMDVAAGADLIVLCGDATSGLEVPGPLAAAIAERRPPVLRCRTRADLHRGEAAAAGRGDEGDVVTAAGAEPPIGLADLAAAVRRALVGDAALTHPGRWRFHAELP
jgi:hypothetical protein